MNYIEWLIILLNLKYVKWKKHKNGKQVSEIDKKAYVLVINNYLKYSNEKSKICLSYSRMKMVIFAMNSCYNVIIFALNIVWTVRTGDVVFWCLLRKLLKKSWRYTFFGLLNISWPHFTCQYLKQFCHLKNKTIKRTKICDNEVSSEYTLLH
jgi:hypothetical protein